jgi:cytidylate kinase
VPENSPKKIIIAIDGPAGSGKGTLAKRLALELGYVYIDTGAMYRCVSLAAMRRGLDFGDKQALADLAEELDIRLETQAGALHVYLNGEEVDNAIRSPEISRLTSANVANVGGVRDAMLRRQRAIGAQGGVVMEGRDIGTDVFPGAQLKIYLDVSPQERARRRIADYQARGIAFDPAQVLEDISRRDAEDMGRPRGALRKTPDSKVIIGDGKSVDQLVAQALALAGAAFS